MRVEVCDGVKQMNPSLEMSSVKMDSLYTRACLLDLTAGIVDLSQVVEVLEEEPSPPWMVQHLDVDQRRLARMTELYAMQR